MLTWPVLTLGSAGPPDETYSARNLRFREVVPTSEPVLRSISLEKPELPQPLSPSFQRIAVIFGRIANTKTQFIHLLEPAIAKCQQGTDSGRR